jgi:cytosine/adenosine deaminase-related metal-dependent hydrolase
MAEARQAMLLQRVGGDAGALTARQALEHATIGGAAVLGRRDIGCLAPGMAADCAVFPLDTIAMAGAESDPVAGLVFCGPVAPRHTIVAGRFVVRDGELARLDARALVARHRALSRALIDG